MDKLLIIDDNDDIRKQLKWGLSKDYELVLAGDVPEALAAFAAQQPKVVTLDLGLPPDEDGSGEGFRCLEEILKKGTATKVIVITGNDGKDNAHRAIQMGAYDYLPKPIDLNELKVVVKRAFHLSRIEEENGRLQSALESKQTGMGGMVGQCPQMQQVFSTIRKVATSDAAVLITGESGTGKELVSRALHSQSLRAAGPLIAINCGAIPENLLESEFFGMEKGAFTGAHARIQGKFEYAHKGTLFLDEIGELPANLQVKLLRYLQEKVLQRVGGREDIVSDTRVVCATNIDIEKAIAQGAFRSDLYYRIAIITINLPPLRERGEDIMLLANLFIKKFSDHFNKKVRGFNADAQEYLETYEWPGNVRELENKIQRAVIMSDSSLLKPEDLGGSALKGVRSGGPKESETLREARERVERSTILLAIRKHSGSIVKTAEDLGVSRPTLYELMKKHGLSVGSY